MNEDFFWVLIEQAWLKSPTINDRRLTAIQSNRSKQLQALGDFGRAYTMTIVENLEEILAMFGKDELTAFIQVFEQKLFNLDRKDLSKAMGNPSGDGFLYARCFVVGLGREYYERIYAHPEKARDLTSAEMFGFVGYKVYGEKFREEFARNQFHCIESYSNKEAW